MHKAEDATVRGTARIAKALAAETATFAPMTSYRRIDYAFAYPRSEQTKKKKNKKKRCSSTESTNINVWCNKIEECERIFARTIVHELMQTWSSVVTFGLIGTDSLGRPDAWHSLVQDL